MTFLRFLLIAVVFLSLNVPMALACDTTDNIVRPQCNTEDLVDGVCVSQNVPASAKLMRSQDYREYIHTILNEAEAYLSQIEATEQAVIVTDLDETVINNIAYYETYGRYDPITWKAFHTRHPERAPYIEPVLSFLKRAQKQGFKVMFITGRSPDQAQLTLTETPGMMWDGVFFKPKGQAAATYKAQVRQMLSQLGYTIVLNIGDQQSDFDLPIEAHQGEFLLPNALYHIP